LATPPQLGGIDEIAISVNTSSPARDIMACWEIGMRHSSPQSLPLKDVPALAPKTQTQIQAIPTLQEEMSSDPEPSESSDSGEEPPSQASVDKGKGKARAEWTPPQDGDDCVGFKQILSEALDGTREQEPAAATAAVASPETGFQVRPNESAADGGGKYSGFRGHPLEEEGMDPEVPDGLERAQAGRSGVDDRGASDKLQIEQVSQILSCQSGTPVVTQLNYAVPG
jgi:hypothetical protein